MFLSESVSVSLAECCEKFLQWKLAFVFWSTWLLFWFQVVISELRFTISYYGCKKLRCCFKWVAFEWSTSLFLFVVIAEIMLNPLSRHNWDMLNFAATLCWILDSDTFKHSDSSCNVNFLFCVTCSLTYLILWWPSHFELHQWHSYSP